MTTPETHQPLLVLTDHELAVLEQAHLRDLGEPRAVRLAQAGEAAAGDGSVRTGPPGQRGALREGAPGEAVLEQARLSLLGRGLVSPDGTMSGLNALADLAVLLLDVRLGAQALVVVERWVAGQEHGPDLRMLHLIPEGGVVEDVHGLGLHGFDLQTDPEELVRDALVPLLPPDAVPGAGPTRRVDASDPAAIAAALGDPQVVAELTLADPSGQRRETWLVAVGRDGCFRSRRPDLGGEQQEGAPRSFEPISPQEIQECLSRWVGGVVDPVE